MKSQLVKFFIFVIAGMGVTMFVFSQSGMTFPTVMESRERPNQQNRRHADFALDHKQILLLTGERNLQGLWQLAAEIEKKWSGDVITRSRLLAEISDSLASYDFGGKTQYKYSSDLARRVLKNADEMPIHLEFRMVSRLSSTSSFFFGLDGLDKWPLERNERIEAMLHLWNRVQKAYDPMFDEKDIRNRPLGNIIVPGGHYPAGVAPEAVKEPDLRAKYLSLIESNNLKAEKFNSQLELKSLTQVFPDLVERNLIAFYSIGPRDFSELQKKIDLFALSPSVRQKILAEVMKTR